jgi:beta-1,4-mannosyltransferase
VKVFFLPWNAKNPYQQNLAEALALHGVEVSGCESRKFLPVLSLLWRYGRPDVLHLHWISGYVVSRFRSWTVLASALLVAELLAMRMLGVRIVWTIHNLVEHKKRNVRFELWIFRWIARICHTLLVHCEHARSAVANAYGVADPEERIVVAPHGNYIGNYPDVVERPEARADLLLPAESFVYLFFGMIQPYKGVEELIESFGALEDPAARLLLAGTCRDSDLERRIVAAAVRDRRIVPILQHIEDGNVQYYMHAADVVVLPFSDVFTSGSAVLAMSFGRALVVPRLGCLPEYVGSRGGILYEPGGTRLLEALRAVVQADCESMGSHNREVAETLDWHATAAVTHAVYAGARPSATGRWSTTAPKPAGAAHEVPLTAEGGA